MKTEDPKLAIFFRVDDAGTGSGDYRLAWASAEICYYKNADWNEDFNFASSYSPIAQYEYIKLKSLLSTDRPGDDCGSLKAYEIGDACSYELKATAKTLDAIGRKIESINAKHGRPATFGQQVLRLAAAVGAETIILRGSEKYQQNTGYKFQYSDLTIGQMNIDRAIADWRARWTVKPAEVAQ